MASPSVPHLLILEPDNRGHTQEWIGHLIAGALDLGHRALLLTFAVPQPFADELAREIPPAAQDQIRVLPLTPRETELCMSSHLVVSGMTRWWTMRRCLARASATHGLFLQFDHLSLPLAFGLGAGDRPLSGILFRPSVHYGQIGPYQPSWRERTRDLRKHLLYRLMLLNPAVRAILSLDPYFVAYARRHYGNGEKVCEAPDPAFPPPAPTAGETALADGVPGGRRLLLLFGELTQRKGLLTLLDALALLSPEDAARLAVIAAGRIEPAIAEAVQKRAESLAQTLPELWLHFENRRLGAGEISALLRRCDMVLAPYQRFVGSSGILLWAARAKRPVLCQDYGLLGRLVRDHGLGITVDSTNASALADKISAVARDVLPVQTDARAMEELCAARTPSHFARAVLEHALPPAGSGTPSEPSLRLVITVF